MSAPPSIPACLTVETAPGELTSSLRVAERVFTLLVTGPKPLALEGRLVGHGLPRRSIPLDELRAILLHPATGQAARDAAWRLLADRARHLGPSWVVGAVGVAIPALRAASTRLRRATGRADIEAELLTGFLTALREVDLSKGRVCARLCNAAMAAGRVAARAEGAAHAGRVTTSVCTAVPPVPFGHPDLLLARAVRAEIISGHEAEVIGATRLENQGLAEYATRIGSTYDAVQRCRARGEKRLVAAIRDGFFSDPALEVIREATLTYAIDLDHPKE